MLCLQAWFISFFYVFFTFFLESSPAHWRLFNHPQCSAKGATRHVQQEARLHALPEQMWGLALFKSWAHCGESAWCWNALPLVRWLSRSERIHGSYRLQEPCTLSSTCNQWIPTSIIPWSSGNCLYQACRLVGKSFKPTFFSPALFTVISLKKPSIFPPHTVWIMLH